MFINKTENGRNNRCGENIARLRTEMGVSQRKLADMLQINGLDIDKNAIQRIADRIGHLHLVTVHHGVIRGGVLNGSGIAVAEQQCLQQPAGQTQADDRQDKTQNATLCFFIGGRILAAACTK